jgi:hypothetical protein
MQMVAIALTAAIARTVRHNEDRVGTPAIGQTIRTEITAPTLRRSADPAASAAIGQRTVQTAMGGPTIRRNAAPVEFTIANLPTTWAEIAAIHNRTTATAVILSLTLVVAVRSLPSAAVIAATRSRVIPHRQPRRVLIPLLPRPAVATAAEVEAGRAEAVEVRAVLVAAARVVVVAEVAVRTAAVLRMDATKEEI